MGLLLSILVSCVGVVELLTFYSNIKRNVTLTIKHGELSEVREGYIKELHNLRERLANDLRCLKQQETEENICCAKPLQNSIEPTKEKYDQTSIEFNREISHEDIELEFARKIVATSTNSSSPRCFLLTEKESNDRSRAHSPRKFVVSEETNSIEKTTSKSLIPEFVIEESNKRNKPSNAKRFVLKDHEHSQRSKSPIPLPKQFLVSEETLSLASNSFYDYLSSGDGGIVSHIDSSLTKRLLQAEEEAPSHSKTPSPIPRRYTFSENEDTFRRSPSPYPVFEITSPRSSVCTELLDNTTETVAEVDEELYRSKSPSPVTSLLEVNSNVIGRSDFESNSITLNIVDKSAATCDIVHGDPRERSPSPFREVLGEQLKTIDRTEIENVSSDFLNKVDGIKTGAISRNSGFRKSIKRKKTLNGPNAAEVQVPMEKNDEDNDNKKSSNVDTIAETSDSSVSQQRNKPGKPFWLIFSGEYTKAMNKDWHGQHFCCWQCDESLTGQRYVLRDDHPYCVSCYESVFANACEKCSRIIGIDSKDLSYKDKHWHEACFLCTTCGESLVDKQFGSKGDRIYCGRCYDEQFASRCDGCHEIFRAGTKKMEYKTRQWHEKCFCCCVCKVPIGTQSFIPREQEIYCAKCYEEKFATRCIKCNKVITSGGVTYKNEPWHRECFTCTHCQKSLAGERFTSRDEKPYCAECFGELFAKRCFACNKPITGIGGTKFISFEDRHWHNDCFFCASCRTSLVGRGFITDQEDIICPECAKQKLM